MEWEKLTLRERVCQLMAPTVGQVIMWCRANNAQSDAFFEKYPVGFLFTEGNFLKNPNERINGEGDTVSNSRLNEILKTFNGRVPICVCADAASGCGGINIFAREFQIGAADDEELAYNAGKSEAMQANYCNVDWLFQPTCDLIMHPMAGTHADSFGGFTELNKRLTTAFIKGIQSQGIAATAKHFPGIGSSPTNMHLAKARNLMSKEEWDASFRVIYKDAIENDVMSIMTTHLALPAYSNKDENGKYQAATVSSEITTDLLKKDLGFDGVVVTDALIMGGIACGDPVKTAIDAFKAGSDVLLFVTPKAVDPIVKLIEKGEIPLERLHDALNRIWSLKKKLKIFDPNRVRPKPAAEFIKNTLEEMTERGIAVIKNNDAKFPIDKNSINNICLVGVSCNGGGRKCNYDLLLEALKNEGFNVDFRESIDIAWQHEMGPIQSKYDLMLFCFAGTSGIPIIPPDNSGSLWSMHKVKDDKKYVIQFGLPKLYDIYFQDEPVYINTHITEINELVCKSLVDVLVGRKEATGKLPVPLDLD